MDNNIQITNDFANPAAFLQKLKTKPESFWQTRGEEMALNLFREMANRVPAYRDFLQKQHINASKINSILDFNKIPTIDKNNYLRFYSREQLSWDGNYKNQSWVFATTSGSTGEPYYFPRSQLQDKYYALTAELYLLSNFSLDRKSTLYIVGFPMGAWIGGLFTYEALQQIAENKKYKLSIITPGINKLEILKAVKNLGNDFDQIIIGSYAPFLKDIIDDGEKQDINWKDYNLGFIFSAEGFSESFRDYIIKKTGLTNPYTSTLNHYGTVDLGTMAHETPLSIFARKRAIENETLYKMLFADTVKLPTLAQYVPEMFYFEEIDGNLLCSSYSGIPLVRYDLKDRGGIISINQIMQFLHSSIPDLEQKLKDNHIQDSIWNLPFVYVYERSDFSVSFYAFQIYPETIRKVLHTNDLLDKLTGKFTMMVTYDDQNNQVLEIHIELKSNISPEETLKLKLQELILQQLLKENSEYRKTYEEYHDKTLPKIVLWQYEHNLHFRPGIKQKWVKK